MSEINGDIAELSLLGSVLIGGGQALGLARGIVKASEINGRRVRAAFEAACTLADGGEDIDPVAVLALVRRQGVEMDDEFLLEVMNVVATWVNVETYARTVHEQFLGRELRNLGARLADSMFEKPQDVMLEALDFLQGMQSGDAGSALRRPVDAANEFYDTLLRRVNGEETAFVSTGYEALDTALGGGLVSPGYITLAGRPGMGKSIAGMCIAENVAAAGTPVLYVSLEMSRNQLMARRIGRLSGVSYNSLEMGTVSPNNARDWQRITRALAEVSSRPMYIEDNPFLSVSDIEMKARGVPGLGLIVIDHIGLVKLDSQYSKLNEQTSAVSHQVMRLSKRLSVPVLSLCQLNRESEARKDKRPQLSDLRNSGAIEEDSNAVIFIHRPDYYQPRGEQSRPWESQPVIFDVAKNRHGATGEASLNFLGITANIWEGKR